MEPADTVTWQELLPLIAGPALWAAALTLAGTVVLHWVAARRENKYRFAADRRAAYADLLAAVRTYQDLVGAVRRLRSELDLVLAGPVGEAEQTKVRRIKSEVERLMEQQRAAESKKEDARAVVALLAPSAVVEKSIALVMSPLEDLDTGEATRKLNELTDAMRADLKIKDKS